MSPDANDEVVGVALEHFAATDAGVVLRVWENAKTGTYSETPIPPSFATTIRTVGDVRDDPVDVPIVDVRTRTLRRCMEKLREELHGDTHDPDWQYLGFHDLRRTWARSLRLAVEPPMAPVTS